jgi:hypothetical protein
VGIAPPQLLTDLRFELGLTRAVETGTLRGNGTATLAAIFPDVVTIEFSPELAAAAEQRFAGNPRVRVVYGESGTELVHHVDSRRSTSSTPTGAGATPRARRSTVRSGTSSRRSRTATRRTAS